MVVEVKVFHDPLDCRGVMPFRTMGRRSWQWMINTLYVLKLVMKEVQQIQFGCGKEAKQHQKQSDNCNRKVSIVQCPLIMKKIH